MRATGIYADIDIDEYHKDEGISSSGISLILDCPKRYWHKYLNEHREPEKNNARLSLGRAMHMFALEPDKFANTYHLLTEEVNLTTKIGKEIIKQAMIEANGREVLRPQDWKDICGMGASIRVHPLWSKMVDAKIEHSIYWEYCGIMLRSRPDIFSDNLIIDLKTTDSISSFSRSIHNYGYHRQAAMQIDGLYKIDGKKRTFAFFAVEKKQPHLTSCFVLDDASIEQGRREYLEGASIYKECIESGVWPGYEDRFQLISLPNYAIKKEEEL